MAAVFHIHSVKLSTILLVYMSMENFNFPGTEKSTSIPNYSCVFPRKICSSSYIFLRHPMIFVTSTASVIENFQVVQIIDNHNLLSI